MEAKATKKNTKVKKAENTEVSLSAKIYDLKGKEAGSVALPLDVFGQKWNADLVHQVVTSILSSQRTTVAHTKNRGEVSGGGKKPWQQKGTGRARHGSIRSPLWVGGGVTHGPRNEKDYTRKVNKKMKSKALYSILSAKLNKGEVLFVSDLSLKAPKTSEAREILSSLSKVSGFSDLLKKRKNSALVALHSKDKNTEKSFRNFGNLEVDEIRNINPVDLMKYKYVVISNPEKGLPQIAGKLE
ncbi:MAG TPA: 50S ribosomal protein L4 [Candidatus Paceibacterota bacterium]